VCIGGKIASVLCPPTLFVFFVQVGSIDQRLRNVYHDRPRCLRADAILLPLYPLHILGGKKLFKLPAYHLPRASPVSRMMFGFGLGMKKNCIDLHKSRYANL
jgi:hypothetical protein